MSGMEFESYSPIHGTPNIFVLKMIKTKQNYQIIPRKAILPVSLYLYCRKPSYDEFGKPRVTTLIYDRSQDIITDEDKEFKDVVSGWFSK